VTMMTKTRRKKNSKLDVMRYYNEETKTL